MAITDYEAKFQRREDVRDQPDLVGCMDGMAALLAPEVAFECDTDPNRVRMLYMARDGISVREACNSREPRIVRT